MGRFTQICWSVCEALLLFAVVVLQFGRKCADDLIRLVQKATEDIFPELPEPGVDGEFQLFSLFAIRLTSYIASCMSYLFSMIWLLEGHALKKFHKKLIGGNLLNFSDQQAKLFYIFVLSIFWILHNLIVCVVQYLDISEKKKRSKRFWHGLLICTLQMFCISNVGVMGVFTTLFFETDVDLTCLYFLYTHVLLMNIGKLRFDDYCLLDSIIGVILTIHLARAWFLYLPTECCDEKESSAPFEVFPTLRFAYLLFSRILVYYCVDYLDQTKPKKKLDERLAAPAKRY